MTQTKLSQLHKIASETRSWAEIYAQTHNFESDLAEMCAIVSAELSRRLLQANFKKVVICETSCHCFLLVTIKKINYLVDLTASQFNEANIIIRPQTKTWPRKKKHYFWQDVKYTFANTKDLLKSQKKGNWPENQWAKLTEEYTR